MQIVFRLCLEGWVDSDKMLDAQIRIEQIWLHLRHTGPGTKSSSWFGSFCCFFFFYCIELFSGIIHLILDLVVREFFAIMHLRPNFCPHVNLISFFTFILKPVKNRQRFPISWRLCKKGQMILWSTSVLPVYWNIRDFHSSSLFNFYAL